MGNIANVQAELVRVINLAGGLIIELQNTGNTIDLSEVPAGVCYK